MKLSVALSGAALLLSATAVQAQDWEYLIGTDLERWGANRSTLIRSGALATAEVVRAFLTPTGVDGVAEPVDYVVYRVRFDCDAQTLTPLDIKSHNFTRGIVANQTPAPEITALVPLTPWAVTADVVCRGMPLAPRPTGHSRTPENFAELARRPRSQP